MEHEREHERERDQTHSYWYIPLAPRVNYSLLVMDSAGMMKMPTGDGIPLWPGAGTGSQEDFGGYKGLRRRNSRLSSVLEVLGYVGIYGCRGYVGGPPGCSRGRGCAQGGGRAPHPRGRLPPFLTWGPSPSGSFPSKNNFSS